MPIIIHNLQVKIIMPPFETIIEQKLQEAIDRGAFDNLSNKGQPLDNSEYFNAPPGERMSFHILKNNDYYPEEVQLQKDIQALKKQLDQTSDSDKADKLEQEIRHLQSLYNQKMEARKLKK